MTYSTKDIFLQRRTSTGTFEESPLAVQPNTVLVIDAGNNLTLIDTSSFIARTGSITFALSSSVCISASYVPNLYPQTEQISASWASASITASYAPVQPSYSSSVSSQFGTKQDTLVTGNTYTITSSFSLSAISSSYSPVEPAYSASISAVKQNILVIGSTYAITSSWAGTASYALNTGNIDGGSPDSMYGGTIGIDGGLV